MAVNEALAVGTLVVVTDTVHFDEIGPAGAGIVVPRNIDALVSAIDRMLSCSQEGRQVMGEAGQRFARERLLWPRIAAQVIEAYQEILSGKLAGSRICAA